MTARRRRPTRPPDSPRGCPANSCQPSPPVPLPACRLAVFAGRRHCGPPPGHWRGHRPLPSTPSIGTGPGPFAFPYPSSPVSTPPPYPFGGFGVTWSYSVHPRLKGPWTVFVRRRGSGPNVAPIRARSARALGDNLVRPVHQPRTESGTNHAGRSHADAVRKSSTAHGGSHHDPQEHHRAYACQNLAHNSRYSGSTLIYEAISLLDGSEWPRLRLTQ